MSRTYIVFGSNDGGQTLAPVGTYEAADHDTARKMARDSGHEAYGSCPVGNWSFGKLSERVIVDIEEIPLPLPDAKQLTVHDALGDDEP